MVMHSVVSITSLVNEPGVSVEESLAASHHNSVAAQLAYLNHGSTSEMAKFNALGDHDNKFPLMVCLRFAV